MGFYHVSRVFAALIISAMLTAPAYGQSKLQEQTAEKLNLSTTHLERGTGTGTRPRALRTKWSYTVRHLDLPYLVWRMRRIDRKL